VSAFEQAYLANMLLGPVALIQLLAMVVSPDVRILYPISCNQQVSLDGFRTQIAQLNCAKKQLTIWLPVLGVYVGSPEIPCLLLFYAFQHHTPDPSL
jgi:hypothetical protein